MDGKLPREVAGAINLVLKEISNSSRDFSRLTREWLSCPDDSGCPSLNRLEFRAATGEIGDLTCIPEMRTPRIVVAANA